MLKDIEKHILNGNQIDLETARRVAAEVRIDELCETADRVRRHFMGDTFDTCSIMNARSGRCSEDCKWCSQSAHNHSEIEVYPLVNVEQAVEHALDNHGKAIARFSLVTSGRTMSDKEIEKAAQMYRTIGENCDIKLCASMGLLNRQQLATLRESGVERYHCNIESSPSFFPTLCTTHTMDEKIQTIRWAQQEGMAVCSGGIIGMGESMEQRIEMALMLRDLGVKSVPLNILNPIKGTKLEGLSPLSDDEIIRTFAIFRLILPDSFIRFAGGRTRISEQLQSRALRGGVNAAIVGDLLTTIGSTVDQDRELVARNGFSWN